MPLKQKLAYIALGVLLVLVCQLGSQLIAGRAMADQHEKKGNSIKIVHALNYPLGKKAEYLEWIKSVSETLQAPEELKRIASYDNYNGSNPHRLVELEFDSMADATKYMEREEIRKIIEDIPNHANSSTVNYFVLRGDYTKN